MKRLLAILILLLPAGLMFAADFHVASNGDDRNPGDRQRPFASLGRARDAVRQWQASKSPRPGATVWIHGGTYVLPSSLQFTGEDGGTEAAPVVYRAAPEAEVRLTGGKTVTGWSLVSDPQVLGRLDAAARTQVLRADLAALSIPQIEPMSDRFRPGGWLELFFNDRPMTLARWPNDDFVTIEKVLDRGVADDGKAVRGGTFVYSGDRPARWNLAEGVWLHGYWCHDWADECIRVGAIDQAQRQITLAAPHGYGIGPSSTWNTHPRRYYAVNLLEELDRPGEWYLDRKAMTLYFWPPAPITGGRVVLSLLKDPLVTIRDASNLVLRDLTLETSLGDGITVMGGSNVLLAGCTFRNLAGNAVVVRGGTRNRVVACDMYQLGRGGVQLDGGDRKSLSPAGHEAVNNHIHHFGRLQKTYAAGIQVRGVGNRAAQNLIHDAPHSAILYGGNEHVIELNEVHHVAMETSDVGAFYTGRDWASRGNLLRWNYIHDLPSFGACGTMGIYLDDCDSGDRLVGNVFYQAGRAAFIGGGRDNTVENNLMIECGQAVHLDTRGLTRILFDTPGGRDSWDLQAKAERLNYQQPPWSVRYPKLARVMQEEPRLPLGNVVRDNVAVDCAKWLNLSGEAKEIVDRLTFENNLILENEDPGFVDAADKDFQLRDDSIVYRKVPGFNKIPMERIGLTIDEYRKTLP